ncbi:phage head closure protein [Bremerella sp. P1]|uniref:phage head closure protein n=1 Tax=Bremerella sp. P1 TaxID=3026424 RepID=UPI003FCD1E39
MQFGKMRHSVKIQRFTEEQQSSGQYVKVWETLASRRVFVEPVATRTDKDAVQVTPEVTHQVMMRFYNLKPDDRLIFNTRILNIVGVRNIDEKNHEVMVDCVESGVINSTYTVEADGGIEMGGTSAVTQ